MGKKKQNIEISITDLNAIARIGYWQLDTKAGIYLLDNISCEILQLPHDTVLTKNEKPPNCSNQDKWDHIQDLLNQAIAHKTSFNHELMVVLPEGKELWILLIGKGDYSNGECISVSGMLQDITDRKVSEKELSNKKRLLDYTENKANLGHWKWDLTMNLITCSENISRVIGTPFGKPITIEKLTEGIHPEDLEYTLKHLKNAVKNKYFKTLVHRFIFENGVERVIQVLGEPIFNDKDELTGFMCSSQDITARKHFENELLKRNQLFNVAQEKAQFGYWQWDPHTNFVTCSDNMARVLSVKENEQFPLSKLLQDVHPKDVDYFNDCLNNIVRTKSFEGFLHRIIVHGRTRYIQVYGKVNTNKDGNVLHVLGISQDVTNQKRIENELVSKNQLLNFAEEISKIGNWQWDLSTNIIRWSANLYRIFEINENDEIIFDTYFTHIHPEDRKMVTTKINNLRKNKIFERVIHRIVLHDGSIKTVELLATVNVDKSGNLIEMIGTLQDVSEQRAQEIKFKGLLESAPNATLILGAGNIVEMINKEAVNLFGYTSEELVGKSVETLIPLRLKEKRAPHKERFLANPKIQKIDIGEDFYMKDKAGNEIPVEVTLGPLRIKGGLIISMVIRDISTERSAERKILKAKNDLELLTKELTAQNHQLADFTQITSHNLRAPVSNLNSLVEIYKMMEDEEDRKELFTKFETVISHLTLTLNTLIEALSAKSHTSLERNDLSFRDTLTKTEEIFTAEIQRTNAVITSDFSEVNSICYHKIYLESIFQNLIGNALKYKSRTHAPQIEVYSKLIDGKVVLSFKDNGLGIDLKKHGHKIFGLNKVFHNHPEAKGIGLFMTKTQIEAMGGKITVNSEVDQGTTFSIHFI